MLCYRISQVLKMFRTAQGAVRYVSTNSAAPLRTKKGRLLESIIRVDHAGEFGADRIYAGQMAVLGNLLKIYFFYFLLLPLLIFFILQEIHHLVQRFNTCGNKKRFTEKSLKN